MTEDYKKTLNTALNILAYAPCTAKTLCDKLYRKGYAREDIKACVEYLYKKGYINEKELLIRTVQLRARRGYGKRRILAYLREKGFLGQVIDENFDAACEDIDFVRYCRERIRQMRTGDPDKILASLNRYGYEYTIIKQAIQEELSENEEV